MVHPGAMRERIKIISRTSSAVDAEGQPTTSDTTVATVYAAREHVGGGESEGADKINARIRIKFIVRYRTDITELMIVDWNSSEWNIHQVRPWPRNNYMTLETSKVE